MIAIALGAWQFMNRRHLALSLPPPPARPRASARGLAACNLDLQHHALRQCASRIQGPSQFQRIRYCASSMSSPNAFLSSPARKERRANATAVSSSPELPSLGELAQRAPKQPLLRSGSHAVPIPATACSTFTSAKELLRQAPEIDIDTEETTPTPPPKPPKPRRKTGARAEAKCKPSTAPAPPAAQNACIVIASSPSEDAEKVWQKPKPQTQLQDKSAQPLADPVQSTLPQGRVTKPAAPSKTKKKTETVSRHFSTDKSKGKSNEEANGPAETKPVDTPTIAPPATPVNSEPREVAVARRNDWTPPTDSAPVDGPGNGNPTSSFVQPDASRDVFQNLCQDFARQTDPSQPPPPPTESVAEILKKRKHVEVVAADDQGLPLQETSTKPAAAKKKTRTLTELAMAPYQQVNPDLLAPGNTDSLLNYFEGNDGAVKALVEHQAAVMDFNKTKAKGKGKAKKPAAKPRKMKAGTLEEPILLSPNTAMKQSSNQDFVFGTSSQLMLEESPTFLREMQAAIQASNRADDDPFASSPTHKATVKRGLWHAGARDSDGDLLELDMVDLAGATTPPALTRSQSAEKAISVSPDDDVFVDIENVVDVHELCPGPSRASGTTGRTALASSLPVKGLRSASRPLLEECQASKHLPPSTLHNFSTTAESSAKAGAASKKKPAKSKAAKSPEPTKKARGRPKKDPAVESPKALATTATAGAQSPKKPRGRPRKDSVTAADIPKDGDATGTQPVSPAKPTTPRRRGKAKQKSTVIEIADSDEEEALSLSSPSSPDLVFSSPPPMDLSLTDDADMSLIVSPTDEAAKLFSLITKAITTSPRSTDPAKPSWHEKILMYEPVILEDLTEWLNGGELTKVGFDGGVTPAKVKQWCESKSVLSIWKATRKGRERKVL